VSKTDVGGRGRLKLLKVSKRSIIVPREPICIRTIKAAHLSIKASSSEKMEVGLIFGASGTGKGP